MKTEPVLIASALVAVISVAVFLGLELDEGWEAVITAAVIAVGALFARSKVSPTP